MIQTGKAKAGGLCPAVVAENTVEEGKAVVEKAKEGTAGMPDNVTLILPAAKDSE